jgi:acyl carrier protein
MTLSNDQMTAFLKDTLKVNEAFDENTELFSSGILDSVAMMNVIEFVEANSGIQVSPADVTLDNFDTVARITSYVASSA